MTLDIIEILKNYPELVLFLLLALAYLIGNLKIGILELGAPPGMLIAGLIFGHFGFSIYPGIETVGLFLFLYAVAFQAGPAFFSVVLSEGKNYISLAALATIAAFVLVWLFTLSIPLESGMAAGVLAGSLTSPAGVAAAIDAIQDQTAVLGATEAKTIISNINVSYAITFLIGDISVLLLARNLPKLFRFDLPFQAKQAAEEKHIVDGDDSVDEKPWRLTLRAYQVNHSELVEKTVAYVENKADCSVLRFKRNGELLDFQKSTPLQLGDRLSIWGNIEQQDLLDSLFGAEVADSELLALKIVNREVVVTQGAGLGKTIKELGMTEQYGCYLTRCSRNGVNLTITPDLRLEQGDIIALSGQESQLDQFASQIGYVERDVNKTDLVTFAAGVVMGFLIGQISLDIGGVSIGLGTAGGLLLIGILLGYLRSLHPTFGRVPPAALFVFKELGLLLFLAGVGVSAGQGLTRGLSALGVTTLLFSLVVATTPVILTFLYGVFVLKMNPALLLGAVTGAVTCTPAMAAVTADARSSIPTIGYAGTYAFGTILSAIACSLMTRF